MIGAAKKQNDATREKIRELFRAADAAKRARLDADARIEKLTGKVKELDTALPGLRQTIKDREYDWKIAMACGSVEEGTAEAITSAEKAIDDAQRAIDVNRATLAGVEDLLAQAINEAPALGMAAEHALLAAWRAVSDHLAPEARAAAEVIRRYYVAELNALPGGVPMDTFLRRTVDLSGSPQVTVELEKEYRG